MKPQCETAAQCLKELARVMEQFGLSSIMFALKSDYIKWRDGTWSSLEIPDFTQPNYWQFAIAEVEGKPVFIGDELWNRNGVKFIVGKITSHGTGAIVSDDEAKGDVPEYCSWNPPKPKTVMVELPYDYVRNHAVQNFTIDATVTNACKLALEKINEKSQAVL